VRTRSAGRGSLGVNGCTRFRAHCSSFVSPIVGPLGPGETGSVFRAGWPPLFLRTRPQRLANGAPGSSGCHHGRMNNDASVRCSPRLVGATTASASGIVVSAIQDTHGSGHFGETHSPKRCFEHCYAARLEAHCLFTPVTRKMPNKYGLFQAGVPTDCPPSAAKWE
jgi:hypothetical protein